MADAVSHRDALIHLNTEYMSWVAAGIEREFGYSTQALLGMSLAEYIPGAIDKICGEPPPRGIFYLIERDGQLAGMGGLRFIRSGVAEIKRLYVSHEWRGLKLGEAMLEQLLNDARAFGCDKVCLDTAPFMQAAHRLYETAGFSDCPPYMETELPQALHASWRFMERTL